jgi:hypothetical protein
MTMDGRPGSGGRSIMAADADAIVDPINASEAHAKVATRRLSDSVIVRTVILTSYLFAAGCRACRDKHAWGVSRQDDDLKNR